MTFASHIETDELNALPLSCFPGTIHVIDQNEAIDEAIRRLRYEKVIGFDTETKPAFKKGLINSVSLMQLATRNDAFLFRLNKTGSHPGLGRLLSDEKILKVGAAIHEDTRNLRTIFNHEIKGLVDLQEMVKNYGIENFGIKKLAAIVLGIRISKSQQLSNWEADILSDAQQSYAATDAWVALEIFLKLRQSQPK